MHLIDHYATFPRAATAPPVRPVREEGNGQGARDTDQLVSDGGPAMADIQEAITSTTWRAIGARDVKAHNDADERPRLTFQVGDGRTVTVASDFADRCLVVIATPGGGLSQFFRTVPLDDLNDLLVANLAKEA